MGTSSDPVTFTLTNTGTSDVHVGVVSLAGADAGQFAIGAEPGADTCSGATVAPTFTCIVEVTFAPTTIGAKTASLDLASDAASGPLSASLTGTGD